MTPNSPPTPNGPLSRLRERAGERVANINTAPGLNLTPLFANGVLSERLGVASKSALSLTLSLKGEGTVRSALVFLC